MTIYKDIKLFPLGSACFVNASLTYNEKLRKYKIFKSPFNGSRLLTNTGIMPIELFIKNNNEFKSIYCNKSNWNICYDGNDIQGHNDKLNIRRCHLKKENNFSFIPETLTSFDEFQNNIKNIIFLVDLTDYSIFENNKLIELKNCFSNLNVLFFLRNKQLDLARRSINKIKKTNIQFDITSKCNELISIFNPILIDISSHATNEETINYMTNIYSSIFEISNS